MFANELTLFAVATDVVVDEQELCHRSSLAERNSSPVALIFVDAPYPFSTEAAGYRSVAVALPEAFEGKVSIWRRVDPTDTVLVISDLNRDRVSSCITFLQQHLALDCRIVAVTASSRLSRDLEEACRLCFANLPVYAEENIARSVDYSLTLMSELTGRRWTGKVGQRGATVVKATVKGGDGSMDDVVMRSRGAPMRFSPPFVNSGFSLSSNMAHETSAGVVVSGSARGVAIYGPYLAVAPGRYEAVAKLRAHQEKGKVISLLRRKAAGAIALDAYIGAIDKVLQVGNIDAGMLGEDAVLLEIQFDVPRAETKLELELRLNQQSNRAFTLEAIDLTWLDG